MSDSEASDEATMVGSPRSPPSPEQVRLPSGFSPPPVPGDSRLFLEPTRAQESRGREALTRPDGMSQHSGV